MKLVTKMWTYIDDQSQSQTYFEVCPIYPADSEEAFTANLDALGLQIDLQAGTIAVYDVETGDYVIQPALLPDLVANLRALFREE